MATSGERRALLFLVALGVLGAGTRAVRARRAPLPSADLDRQIAAVESSDSRPRRRPPKRQSRRVDTIPALAAAPSVERVDLDRATAEEIERLPGIGPALARRIVQNRDSLGAFGCRNAVDGVKGIGVTVLNRIDTLIAFSGTKRPECKKG